MRDWCKQRLNEKPVILTGTQRSAVEEVIARHAKHREWELHAVSVRTNHVHVAVSLIAKIGGPGKRTADGIKRVRDEFKANSTRVLRQIENSILNGKIWTKGGDIQMIDTDEDLDSVVMYITEAQDRMDRPKE